MLGEGKSQCKGPGAGTAGVVSWSSWSSARAGGILEVGGGCTMETIKDQGWEAQALLR